MTRVTIVHVIETIEGLPFEELRPFYERMERNARTTMNGLVKRAPKEVGTAAHALAYGRRAEGIVRSCGSERCRSHRPRVASRQSVEGQSGLGHHQL